jgi:hypothetical protein
VRGRGPFLEHFRAAWIRFTAEKAVRRRKEAI